MLIRWNTISRIAVSKVFIKMEVLLSRDVGTSTWGGVLNYSAVASGSAAFYNNFGGVVSDPVLK